MNLNLLGGFFILSLDNFKEIGGVGKERKKFELFKVQDGTFSKERVVADPNPNFFRNKEQGYKGGRSR